MDTTSRTTGAAESQVRRASLPRLMSIADVADVLGTTERHVRRLVDDHRIEYHKVGHFVRFDPDEVARYLDATRVERRAADSRWGGVAGKSA